MGDNSYSSRRLRELIDAQGRRYDWLAARIDKDPSILTKILKGTRILNEETARRAADVLQVPVEWLREDPALESPEETPINA